MATQSITIFASLPDHLLGVIVGDFARKLTLRMNRWVRCIEEGILKKMDFKFKGVLIERSKRGWVASDLSEDNFYVSCRNFIYEGEEHTPFKMITIFKQYDVPYEEERALPFYKWSVACSSHNGFDLVWRRVSVFRGVSVFPVIPFNPLAMWTYDAEIGRWID